MNIPAESDNKACGVFIDRWKNSWWLWVLVLSPAIFFGCWNAKFFDCDDPQLIVENKLLDPETSLKEIFIPKKGESFFYPLTLLTWRIDRALWRHAPDWLIGENGWATGIRAGNLLLHFGAGVFLWLLLLKLGLSRNVAGFVMLAFALHPSVVESVCWPVERKHVLAGFFGLSGLYVYIRARSGTARVCSVLLYQCALLAKPSALALLPVVVLYEFFLRPSADGAGEPEPWRLRPALGRVCPWVLLTGLNLYAFTRLNMSTHFIAPPPGGSLYTALLTDVYIIYRYVFNLLLPHRIAAYYYIEPIVTLTDWRLWAYGGAGLVLSALTIFLARKEDRRLALFGWLWFVCALGPHLNLISLADFFHDRFYYLAAPGFWLALALAAKGVAARLPAINAQKAASVTLIVFGLVWASFCVKYSYLYADAAFLFSDTVQKEPQSIYGRHFLSTALLRYADRAAAKGDTESAAQLLEQTVREINTILTLPDLDRYMYRLDAHLTLGVIYAKTNRPAGAAEQLEIASKMAEGRPHTAAVLSCLAELQARVAMANREFTRAAYFFGKALEYLPRCTRFRVYQACMLFELSAEKKQTGERETADLLHKQGRALLESIEPGQDGYAEAQAVLETDFVKVKPE
jgi:hypothetical protein